MQMLFQWEMSQKDPRKLVEQFWKGASAADLTESFANELFEGAAKQIKDLDALIEQHSEWKMERISAIDRAILRLAIHELQSSKTPPRVVINEAIVLAKKFSGEDSGSFVNGILDAATKTIRKQ